MGKTTPHWGIDVKAPLNTPIMSPVDGVIANKGWNPKGGGFGPNFVIIKDKDDNYHILGHNSKRGSQKEGQKVKKGEVVAYVGNEGFSSGPHLHWEIRKGGLGYNYEPVVAWINRNEAPTNTQTNV